MLPTESSLKERTEEKLDEIATHFPELKLLERRANGETVWEGWLKPVISRADYGALLDDLDNDREVKVYTGKVVGVQHSTECEIEHTENDIAKSIGNPFRLFRIRVTDFDDRKMPLCQMVEPEITEKTRYHTRGLDGMCLYPPWTFPWTDRSSIIDLLKHALIWLIKWDVFDRTGKWIGSETPHTFDYLLANVRPSDSCTCFSGSEYGSCCRSFHLLVVTAATTIATHRRKVFQTIYPNYIAPLPQTLLRFLKLDR